MSELAPKRNSELYEKYSIKGYPSFYYSIKAIEKYNNHTARMCNHLPENSTDFTSYQRFVSFFYCNMILRVMDAVWHIKEIGGKCD